MPRNHTEFRPARREDAALLAELVNSAGEGLPRCGYAETAQREMVKEGWENPGRNRVLLTKYF